MDEDDARGTRGFMLRNDFVPCTLFRSVTNIELHGIFEEENAVHQIDSQFLCI